MNKDDSEQSSSCAVKSKYFTSKSAMDESLSDFQETKKSCAGPKNTAKTKSSKPRKAPKRIRGQKDIRKVLQSKTNELESYSKDFNKVCKKAGIDIDSEELQLAIALSKLVQDSASTSNAISGNSQPINSQERIRKIRTTLQEYGFKVPEVKITSNTRKVRKHRNKYKLISTSDIEKKEIIANKYSNVLFQNLTQCSLFCSNFDGSNIPLFYLASNTTYDTLKITDTFYVKNLIEKSTNSTGNLLRDWSEIPGRPVSPTLLHHINMNFSEIECSQEELDIVLSGTLKNCKNIFSKKTKDLQHETAVKIVVEIDVNDLTVENNKNTKEIILINHDEETLKTENNSTTSLMETFSAANQYRSCSPDIFDDDASYICTTFEKNKSSSVSGKENLLTHETVTNTKLKILDLTECVQNKNDKPHYSDCDKPQSDMFLDVTKRKSNDLMELTECIQIQSKDKCSMVEQPQSQLSQNMNFTKRRSNDYMEITECVATLSQHKEKNTELKQEFYIDEKKHVIDKNNQGECNKTNPKPEKSTNLILAIEHNKMDLTVSPDNHIGNVKSNNENPEEVNTEKSIEILDLTPSSNYSDELPFVSLTAAKDNSLDDTIIVDVNDYADINKKINLQYQVEEHIDLTQYPESINKGSTESQSFFEEYNHDHSSNSTEGSRKNNSSCTDIQQSEPDKIDLTQNVKRNSNSDNNNWSKSNLDHVEPTPSPVKTPTSTKTKHNIIEEPVPVDFHCSNSSYKYCEPGKVDLTLSPVERCDNNENNDIDLTQNSDTSEDFNQTTDNEVTEENELATAKNSQRYSSLGKQDDVSIDYDDFLNVKANNENSCSNNASPKSVIYDIADENDEKLSRNNSLLSNCSQNSEVFQISDKELDYSMHRSKLEIPGANFSFGGISVLDELSNLRTSKKSIDVDNTSTTNNLNEVDKESFPTVSIKNNQKYNRGKEISPIKHRRITEITTPQKACSNNVVTVVTPKNSEFILKMNPVTPIIDYESMSTPDLHNELDRYGIKPFKRKRAIQLLTHIYNQTHPIIETYNDELASPPKRHKPNDQPTTSPKKFISPRKLLKSPQKYPDFEDDIENNGRKNISENLKSKDYNVPKKKSEFDKSNDISGTKTSKGKGKGKRSLENRKKTVPESMGDNDVENVSSRSKNVVFQGTDNCTIVRDIECKPEDWVFQKREKAKMHSCRVPLHIAFHNYVSSRRDLREAILCYKPVEIDVIHKDLVGYGYRYDPKDLLKFMDKKCITVKTADNDARNQK